MSINTTVSTNTFTSDPVYVGLDVHKDTIAIAYCNGGGEPVSLGIFPSDFISLKKALAKIARDKCNLHVVYEAGPTGYGICRFLRSIGIDTKVIAPSLVPITPSDRVKTDKRDAIKLTRLHRSGMLTTIYVPDEADESFLNLVRQRVSAKQEETRAKNKLSMFLLRNYKIRPPELRTTRSNKYYAWLNAITFEQNDNQVVFEYLLSSLKDTSLKLDTLEGALFKSVESHPKQDLIKALQALRGVQLLTAATIVAEVSDFKRFSTAPQFMSYVGVVPREHSSGTKQKRGSITKAGCSELRHVLIESSHHYRYQPFTSSQLQKRQSDLPPEIISISYKAQVRLHEKYRSLAGRIGKPKAIVAVSRELAGFIFAIAKEVEKS